MACPSATARIPDTTSAADASFRIYPEAPARMHSRKHSGSSSMSMRTTSILGTIEAISEIKEQSESRAVSESRITMSVSAAATAATVSGRRGETPQIAKFPLFSRSFVSDSRNKRFPATKKTDGLLINRSLPQWSFVKPGPSSQNIDAR